MRMYSLFFLFFKSW